MSADFADMWIEANGLESYLAKRKAATQAVAQILLQYIELLQTAILEDGQPRQVRPGPVQFQAGPAAWQGQAMYGQGELQVLPDQPWGLQERMAGECLCRYAGGRLREHVLIVSFLIEHLPRLDPYMVPWGNIGPRQYTFDVIDDMVRQGFLADDYIAVVYNGGHGPDFRRRGNWGIHAVFVQFPELRRELEDGPVGHMEIWDELSWYPEFMEAFREIISYFFNELTSNDQLTWSYYQLSVSMEDRAREVEWRRKSFPPEVLIDQYALNQPFYDAVGQLPPARENPSIEDFEPHFQIIAV